MKRRRSNEAEIKEESDRDLTGTKERRIRSCRQWNMGLASRKFKPETRGRPAGFIALTKPDEELSAHPRTVQARKWRRDLSPDVDIIRKAKNSNRNVEFSIRKDINRLLPNGLPKFPRYYNASESEKPMILQHILEEKREERFKMGKSAEAKLAAMRRVERIEAEEEETRQEQDIEVAKKRLSRGKRDASPSPPTGPELLGCTGVAADIIKRYERFIFLGGKRALEAVGSANPQEEISLFRQQILDPINIGDASYEYPRGPHYDDPDVGANGVGSIQRETKGGVTEVFDEEESDEVEEEEALDSEEDCFWTELGKKDITPDGSSEEGEEAEEGEVEWDGWSNS